MRRGWVEAGLGQIADVTMGQSPPGSSYNTTGDGLPFMQGSAEFGQHFPEPVKWCSSPARVAEPGDVLLSVRAPVGDTNIANQRLAIGRGLATVRGSKHATSEFLRLLIQHNASELNANSGTGMFASITGKSLKEFEVQLPPMPEQKRIVDLVSSVDTYIDALQKQADVARNARNAVLHELLSAGGDDWTETTLGEVAEWFSGGTPRAGKPEFYEGGNIPWVVISDLMKPEIYETATCITPAGLYEIGGRLAPVGSVLISMYATVGRPGIAHVPVATNQAIAWSIPNESLVKPRFLLFVAQSLEEEISSMARGATQRNINRAMLKEFAFLLPPLVEQHRIVEIVSSMDEVIQSTEQAVVKAQSLRSGLLSDLLSGEHEIPESYDRLLGAA